jgi:hypothetical protein
MIWRKSICVITCFLMLITVASALLPDYGTASSSKDWPVANTIDSSIITLQVKNLSTGNIVTDFPVTVMFAVDNPVLGYVSPNGAPTVVGIANTTFKVNQTSGTAFIHACWTLTVGSATIPIEVIYPQKIDHGPAQLSSLSYQSEVIVGQTTPFILTLKDWYGNRVENKNPNQKHNVKFRMYFPPGGTGSGGLKNATSAYLTTLSDMTDDYGNITLTAKVDTVPGENNIWISAIESMPDPLYPYITGISQAPPFYIEQAYQPDGSPPRLPADQSSKFTITYTLLDQYRNPTANHTIQIYTSKNESIGTLRSNSLGQVWVTYGPKSISEDINITARATQNSSVSCSKIVEFYSVTPVSMVFSAVPQSMASRDVPTDPAPSGEIRAKVMDGMGNPAPYELVTFSLIGYTNSTVLTKLPSFDLGAYTVTKTARTDNETGIATIDFYPGEFPVNGSYYCQTATGTAVVRATWAGYTALPVTISFKNYPYLRIETTVTPESVEVNETFEVDIKMIGDGWKMTQKDIDVVLVFDKSGSMEDDTPTRISQAKAATNTFVDEMSTRDQIGLVTFSSSTSLDQVLTLDHNAVKNKINALSGSGSTQERTGIYTGINELKTNRARAGAVKAIIMMTDGNWNKEGTPLGHGTGYPANNTCEYTFSGSDIEPNNYRYYDGLGGTLTSYWSDDCWATKLKCTNGEFTSQNMSRYAKANNIRIYTISFASVLDPTAVQALQIMATDTGGFYSYAPDGDQLKEIYKRIAGDLRSYAGVNTQMSLSFQNVNVTFNNVTTSYPGSEVFQYNYTQGSSTWVTSWNDTMTPLPDHIPTTPSTHPGVLPAYDGTYTTYPYSFNQMGQWQSNSLYFNAGNITVNQTWETKFWFKVIKPGNIDIFGSNSSIIFDNGAQTLQLPRTYITAVLNRTSSGINATTLDIYNLMWIGSGEVKDFIPLRWQITYGGNQTVTERISYSSDGGLSWVLFDTNYIDNTVTTDYSTLDVRTLPPGVYFIRVDASAPDAPSDREQIMTPGIVVGTAGRAFIKLE